MNQDLTVGKPEKVLWAFCLPLFGSVIFQQMYNIADSLIAGKYIGEDALAAVGNSYEITLIFIAFAMGCNIGCSVITSRYFGAKEYGKMKTAVSTSMITSALMGLALMLTGIFGSAALLSLINTPDNVYADSKLYLDIYVWGLPFVFFYNIATGVFSALGDSKTPFRFLAVSSLANIGMDILFVYNFNMGVAGVAWATFICQGVSCVLAMTVVLLRLKKIKTDQKFSPFSFEILKKFLNVAIPSVIQQSFVSVGNLVIQSVINSFGSAVMAGYSAGVKLNNLVITSYVTIGNGISNYTSQNIGGHKTDRLSPGFKAGIKLIWAITVPFCLLYLIAPRVILGFFLENPSQLAMESGMYYLRILAPFYFVVSVKLVADGMLRGASAMRYFMISTFTDLILRVVLAFVLSETALGYLGIWCAWPVGWVAATAVSIFFYFKGKWRKKLN